MATKRKNKKKTPKKPTNDATFAVASCTCDLLDDNPACPVHHPKPVPPPIQIVKEGGEPDRLFGNHIRELIRVIRDWRASRKPEPPKVKFTPGAVKGYLNRCIKSWKKREDRSDNFEDTFMARCNIEALEGVKEALFGKSKRRNS